MKMKYKLTITALSLLGSSFTHATETLALGSSAFVDGGILPLIYTCDGQQISPPLNWKGIPSATKSLVLIMDHQPQGKVSGDPHSHIPKEPSDITHTHSHHQQESDTDKRDSLRWYWSMYNISPTTTNIKAGESQGILGSNIVNLKNQYAAPCSKGPGAKQYRFHLYALSSSLTFSEQTEVTAAKLRETMKGLVLSKSVLSVNYTRQNTASTNNKKLEKSDKVQKRRPPKPSKQLTPPTIAKSINSKACSAITASVQAASFENVFVTCDNTYAYVQSNTYPNHSLMNGITGSNEQIPVPALNYAAPILLTPQRATEKTTIDAALGVAVNGVPIYDYSAQGELHVHTYDPKKDTVLLGQLDECGGHAGRGDDYHYHAKPTCMIDNMKKVTDATIIGWGYDGFPLFGDNNPDGTKITDGALDVCNGQADNTFGYRYHTSVKPPYIFQCLVGKVDTTLLPRVAPLDGASTRADLKPPREGVENLTHTQTPDGTRIMRYSYQGEQYYSRYTPSKNKPNCYDFEQKTISNNGRVETGTYCR